MLQAQSGRHNSSEGDLLKHFQEHEVEGQVSIEVDSLLTSNYYKLLNQNSIKSGVPGYRIRIYSESGLGAKEEQQRVKARFLTLYPEVDAYNRYDEPYFKVYVGDCRTRSEALKLYDRISRAFPDAIIREDYINLENKELQIH
jgi:hypothetical protein